MKRVPIFFLGLWLSLSGLGQQLKEESLVINIEVPVRVFQGDTFIDNLKAEDFELLENGLPQKIEAVYLVKNRAIARREEEKTFLPQTTRNFYLVFEITNYVPQIDEALRNFVYKVLVPSDNVVLVTPLKTYHVLSEALAAKKKEDILRQFTGILRRDATIGATEYREIVVQLGSLARTMSQQLSGILGRVVTDDPLRTAPSIPIESDGRTIEELMQIYGDILAQLDNLRAIDQQRLLGFSSYLKNIEGQKNVFLFYEREFVPKIDPKILWQYIDAYQDRPELFHTVTSLFEFYKREFLFDPDLIMRSFADSSISCHFLFITAQPEVVTGVRMEEQSEDVFSTFREIARANGGFIQSSANPAYLMRTALDAAENYYLLYYSPQKYLKDGKFREIKVRLKNGDYRIIHRLGYYAN